MPETELRALMFFALVVQIVALILINRSVSASSTNAVIRHSLALRYFLAAIAAVTALILRLPQAQGLLTLGLVSQGDAFLALSLGVGLLVPLEVCKQVSRHSELLHKAI